MKILYETKDPIDIILYETGVLHISKGVDVFLVIRANDIHHIANKINVDGVVHIYCNCDTNFSLMFQNKKDLKKFINHMVHIMNLTSSNIRTHSKKLEQMSNDLEVILDSQGIH